MIDPDLIEARAIVKATLRCKSHQRCSWSAGIDAGIWDAGHEVRAALAGIKRGRDIAQRCRCAVCVSDVRGLAPCLNDETRGDGRDE